MQNSKEPSITFPATSIQKFFNCSSSLRYGQAFHQYMKLDKVTNPVDRQFCDQLYNEVDCDKAKSMIASRIDYNQ